MEQQYHKNLDVWKLSTQFALSMYKTVECFPKIEQFNLADQLRRASISIPSNIAEGSARNTNKEKIQFFYIARGSCSEVDTQLFIAKELGYISIESYTSLVNDLARIGQMLSKLIQSFKNRE